MRPLDRAEYEKRPAGRCLLSKVIDSFVRVAEMADLAERIGRLEDLAEARDR